ncbi:hypothetical protein LWI28_025953 [Acer negundo]|uniref:Uncharacterized protein n=1 Tax=Acer negundo TaxID=4023 RepID=A0AAD5J295_ACENE|nr:hypothetical protein LWI28_025953 [Acer negundo]
MVSDLDSGHLGFDLGRLLKILVVVVATHSPGGSSELDSTDGNVWTARLNKNDWTETATAPQQIAETIDHNEDEKHREVGVYRSHGGA